MAKKIKVLDNVSGVEQIMNVSSLASNGTITGTDLMLIEQSNTLKKVSITDLSAEFGGGGGADVLQTITMSANATYNKSDLTGNILFLSTNDSSTRTFTVGTGFVANDKLTFVINWQNLGLIRLSIGGRNIWDIRGVILQFVYDGTYWRSLNNSTWVQDSGISNTIILGEVLNVGSSDNSIAIGRGTLSGDNNVFISPGTSSLTRNQSIHVGKGTIGGEYSVLIGMNDLNVGSENTGAIGINADALANGIGIGGDASVNGICIGTTATNNNKDFAKSIGNFARGVHKGEIVFKIDNKTNYSSTANQSHLRIVNFGAITTNDTQTEIYLNDSTSADRLVIPAKSSYMIKGRMSAVQSDFSDIKHWEFNCSLLRDGSNNTSLQGTTNITVLQESSGATTWDLILSADNTNESLKVEVIGQASQTIYWKGIFEIIDLMLP